jgi:hypothetical protein
MLLDVNLQRRLTADEFRAWINLNVWVQRPCLFLFLS